MEKKHKIIQKETVVFMFLHFDVKKQGRGFA